MHYEDIDPILILDFLYSFGLTCCLCIIGSFLREYYRLCRYRVKISFINVLVPSIFTSFILRFAVLPHIKEGWINGYIVTSLICGLWSNVLLDFACNATVVAVFVKNIFKQMKNPVLKGISDSMAELDKKEEEKKKELEEKEKAEKENKESSNDDEDKKESDDNKIINIEEIPR